MKTKISLLSLAAVTACTLVIVLLTSIPLTAQQRAIVNGRDKLIHASVFAVLTICVAWAVSGYCKGRARALLVTAVIVLIFASIDELIQYFVPTRTLDWKDWLANCFGIAVGLAAFTLISIGARARFAKTRRSETHSGEE